MKKNIAVIFGGTSNEHEISKISAVNVLQNLPPEKYNVIVVGITKSGKWLRYSGSFAEITESCWEDHPLNREVIFSLNTFKKGIFVFNRGSTEFLRIDVVFPVLHGKNGEDGKVQALLELSELPFVGCSSASSSNCMDKITTNILLENSNIKKPKYFWFYFSDYKKNPEEIIKKIEEKVGDYPLFVKPSRSGSSIGISKAKDKSALRASIEIAAREDIKILVEEAIVGKELECAILGDDEVFVSVVGEIIYKNEFYSYESKYTDNAAKLCIPANIDKKISENIQKIAAKAYKILECSGLSRIDFFLRKNDFEILLNEINTIPGFTNASMYSKLMRKSGVNFPRLLDKLIDLAIQKSKSNTLEKEKIENFNTEKSSTSI
ncbi:MAG: D-alanine--D-alanine ligase [Oscillospiraceae bacterium]|jgi:D-alanine-D-alanine ligase|nr:D-alanine--D-alanine ligase [Oscillospiraceae bacterium]